jgi:hypothetical protein
MGLSKSQETVIILAISIFVAVNGLYFTGLSEVLFAVEESDSFDNSVCNDVDLQSETTEVTEVRGNVFDIEQFEEPVLRILVPPVDEDYQYLVLEKTVIDEEGNTLEQSRIAVNAGDEAFVTDMEINQQNQTFAETVSIEPVGCTNNPIVLNEWD